MCIIKNYMFLFYLQEHYNFCASDEKLGPILLSVKAETVAGIVQTSYSRQYIVTIR